MKGKHAQKNFGTMAPTPLSLKTREGGGGGGGVSHTRTGPGSPPVTLLYPTRNLTAMTAEQRH